MNQAVKVIQALGPGTQLVKFDIKNAYRSLDSGHRIARRSIFGHSLSVWASLYPSVMANGSLNKMLDDLLLFGAPGRWESTSIFDEAIKWYRKLEALVTDRNTEGPASVLTFWALKWTRIR